jgi:hypothetical protein
VRILTNQFPLSKKVRATEVMNLKDRVLAAAEAVLERDNVIGLLELLQQLLFLQPCHVQQWQKGNEYYSDLESHIQLGEKKLHQTYQYFFDWVKQKNLQPIEGRYETATRHGSERRQISISGTEDREKFFRTQYRSADLPPAKLKRLETKQNKAPELTVFQIVSDSSSCSECQTEILRGELIFLEKQQPLCLACADMDHLEFLPSGDTALTRRTKKYSSLTAIVVRFNRSRKRYERQGILATPEAIAQAEDECADDAQTRAARRKVDAVRRQGQDKQFVAELTAAILVLFPNCPKKEAAQIAAHTALRGSGRVGRSAAGRDLKEDAVRLATRAWIRHQHTPYDKLLMQGYPRDEARDLIARDVERVDSKWS